MDERPDSSQQLMDILLGHGRERHAPSRQRSKGRRVTDQEPLGGQQRPPAGGSPR